MGGRHEMYHSFCRCKNNFPSHLFSVVGCRHIKCVPFSLVYWHSRLPLTTLWWHLFSLRMPTLSAARPPTFAHATFKHVTNCENKTKQKKNESKTINPLLMACVYSSLQFTYLFINKSIKSIFIIKAKITNNANALINPINLVSFNCIATRWVYFGIYILHFGMLSRPYECTNQS